MSRHVALLRAINLGPRNRLPMARLRELLEAAGHQEVVTVGQSGNVVLRSRQSGEALRERLERELRDGHGSDVDVIVRSAAELHRAVAANPLPEAAADPKRFQVTFLATEPSEQATRELQAADLGDERLAVRGREIYVWHTAGIQRSPAARLLGAKRLGLHGTARNWNTVLKLDELLRE